MDQLEWHRQNALREVLFATLRGFYGIRELTPHPGGWRVLEVTNLDGSACDPPVVVAVRGASATPRPQGA